MREGSRWLMGTALALTLSGLNAQSAAAAEPLDAQAAVMDEVVAALCDKDVVMLGEASHGDGRAFAFKSDLIPVLIQRFGFDAVAFEGSLYESLALAEQRLTGESVSAADVGAIAGQIWNGTAEVRPLFLALADALNKGRLQVWGLDDQMHAGPYLQGPMLPRLFGVLDSPRQTECRTAMQAHMNWSYSDAAPYDVARQTVLRDCLAEVVTTIEQGPSRDDPAGALLRRAALALSTGIARDFLDAREGFAQRDKAMFENLQWQMARTGARRVLIWTHNLHAAREIVSKEGAVFHDGLGSLVAARYGEKAYALGIGARSGSYAMGRRAPSAIPSMDADALESRVLGDDTTLRFASGDALRKWGRRTGHLFNYEAIQTDWSQSFDGVLVFAEEHPPTRTPQ